MKLENQVVSLELSKKLKELGVKQESYFYWTQSVNLPDYEKDCDPYVLEKTDDITDEKGKLVDDPKKYRGYINIAPAYTVAELGEMLPDTFYARRYSGKYYADRYEDNCDLLQGFSTEANARAGMLIDSLQK